LLLPQPGAPTALLALKITTQVGEWLRNHIRKTDVGLGKFIQAAG